MNKIQFKKQIDNFLQELQNRYKDVQEGYYICDEQVGKSLFDFARKNFTKDLYPLVYSVKNVKLEYIFHLGNKNALHNASNQIDIERLYNALKYQILANKNLYSGITASDFYYVYWGYIVRLAKNFNWTSTYNTTNVNEYGLTIGKDRDYIGWTRNFNILSNSYILKTYNEIFVQNLNTVIDINGDEKVINIKNSDYNTMKKLSKEQIINIINLFENKPTVKEITDKYMSTVELINTDTIEDTEEYERLEALNKSKIVTTDTMRKYIKSYELEDMIKTCNHTEKFNNKKK